MKDWLKTKYISKVQNSMIGNIDFCFMKFLRLFLSDSLKGKSMEIIDHDILQIKDETNKKWVNAWKKEVLKKQK